MTAPATVEPLAVAWAQWRLLALAGVVGALAGVVAARAAPPSYEVQDVLLVGSVGSDPLHPGSRIALQNPEELVAWLKAGDQDSEFDVNAELEGAWMVRLHVKGRDKDGAVKLAEKLLGRIEADHRIIYDGWQKQTGSLQASLEQQAAPEATAAMAHSGTLALTGPQQASLVATVRGPIYSRPTARVAAPWVSQLPAHQARIAIGGMLAAIAIAWAAAFALTAMRRA